MTQFDMRSIRNAPDAQMSSKAETRKLSEGAETAANERLAVPYSPIVLAGTVRMIEFALVALVGFAVYVAYVLPHDGFEWYYVGAIVGVAILALLAFQIFDIYQVQAFRGHEKQYFRLASAWSVVFLIAIGVSFFARPATNSPGSGSAASTSSAC